MLLCSTCLCLKAGIELAERAYAEKRGALADFPDRLPVSLYTATRSAANDALIDLRPVRADREWHEKAHGLRQQKLVGTVAE
jgi:hypothetical protein